MFQLLDYVLSSSPLTVFSSLFNSTDSKKQPSVEYHRRSSIASVSSMSDSEYGYDSDDAASTFSSPASSQFDLPSTLAFPNNPVFYLPDLINYCPFELQVNPHFLRASQESEKWFDSYDIHTGRKRTEFLRAKFSLLPAMSYPTADYDHLRICCDFMAWLFAFDDLTDDGGLRENVEGTRLANQIMMDALCNPETYRTEFKVGETIRNWWERACMTASEGTQRRFVQVTQEYADAIYQQVVNRRHDEIPNIETFIQLRRDTSAAKLCFALVEYSLNLSLPDEVFNDPPVKSLEQGANDILTWANDMYSFNIEQSKGETQNLIVVAMKEKNLDLQESVDWVGDLIKTRMDQYVEEKSRLPSWGAQVDDEVAQYVAGMENWVIGALHWIFDSERYFGKDHAMIKADRVVTLLPVDTSMLDNECPLPASMAC